MSEIDWKARAKAAEAREAVLRDALNEAWEVEAQDPAALTPFGKAMLDRWATALRDTAEAAAARDAQLREEGRRAGIEDAARVAQEVADEGASCHRVQLGANACRYSIRALLNKPAGEDGR